MADNVNCHCGEKAMVMESRTILWDGNVTIWRRRVCHYGKPLLKNARCDFNHQTIEIEQEVPNALRS